MKKLLRALMTTAFAALMVAGPAAVAGADTSAEDALVEVRESECPDGYTGVVLDFYVGEPPRHVYTLRLCQNIVD